MVRRIARVTPTLENESWTSTCRPSPTRAPHSADRCRPARSGGRRRRRARVIGPLDRAVGVDRRTRATWRTRSSTPARRRFARKIASSVSASASNPSISCGPRSLPAWGRSRRSRRRRRRRGPARSWTDHGSCRSRRSGRPGRQRAAAPYNASGLILAEPTVDAGDQRRDTRVERGGDRSRSYVRRPVGDRRRAYYRPDGLPPRPGGRPTSRLARSAGDPAGARARVARPRRSRGGRIGTALARDRHDDGPPPVSTYSIGPRPPPGSRPSERRAGYDVVRRGRSDVGVPRARSSPNCCTGRPVRRPGRDLERRAVVVAALGPGARMVWLHHVHGPMWPMSLPPGLAQAGRLRRSASVAPALLPPASASSRSPRRLGASSSTSSGSPPTGSTVVSPGHRSTASPRAAARSADAHSSSRSDASSRSNASSS